MKMKLIIVAALLAQGTLANAGNRDGGDALFNEPAKNGGTQVLLGIGELIVAERLKPGMSETQKMLSQAEAKLQLAQDLPTSEAQRKATLKAILENTENYTDEIYGEENREVLKPRVAKRVESLKSAAIVTRAEKAAAVQAMETSLSAVRASALESLQKVGALDKSIRIVRYGASLVLVGDVAARVYIWNALDANPTLSPAAAYIDSLLNK